MARLRSTDPSVMAAPKNYAGLPGGDAGPNVPPYLPGDDPTDLSDIPNWGNSNPRYDVPPLQAPSAPDAPAPAPPQALPGPKNNNYQGVPGWEIDRLNNPNDTSGKYELMRWIQDNGYGPGGPNKWGVEGVNKFLASNSGWEGNGNANDPWIRQKQDYLSEKDPGRQTRWQDVIRDAGGENGYAFQNAETLPGDERQGDGGPLLPWPVPGGGGGGKPPSGGGGGGTAPLGGGNIMDILKTMFPDGAFNKEVVDRRVSNVSDVLNRNRKSQMATNSAALASRGQGTNDGTFGTSAGNLETRLGQQFNESVNDIYATEGEAADKRMMEALSLATGMTIEDAKRVVEQNRINSDDALGWGNINLGHKNADINRMLGLGNLANSNSANANNYNLGLGRLGLDRDALLMGNDNASLDRILEIIRMWGNGNNTGNGGFI